MPSREAGGSRLWCKEIKRVVLGMPDGASGDARWPCDASQCGGECGGECAMHFARG